MTFVSGNAPYPTTDEVLTLYQEIETAHSADRLTEQDRGDLLEAAAGAESREDIDRVRQQLKEHAGHEVE